MLGHFFAFILGAITALYVRKCIKFHRQRRETRRAEAFVRLVNRVRIMDGDIFLSIPRKPKTNGAATCARGSQPHNLTEHAQRSTAAAP